MNENNGSRARGIRALDLCCLMFSDSWLDGSNSHLRLLVSRDNRTLLVVALTQRGWSFPQVGLWRGPISRCSSSLPSVMQKGATPTPAWRIHAAAAFRVDDLLEFERATRFGERSQEFVSGR